MRLAIILVLLSLLITIGCVETQVISYDPLYTKPIATTDCLIPVYHRLDQVPTGAETIGDVAIDGSLLPAFCGLKRMIRQARVTACQHGAQAIRISKLKSSQFLYSCAKVRVEMLRIDDWNEK